MIVKNFCDKAGLFSKHSGKSVVLQIFLKHYIDEQLIMKQTGHRSQDAVRKFKGGGPTPPTQKIVVC